MSLLHFFESTRIGVLNIVNFIFSLLGEEIFFLCVLGVIFWCIDKKVAYRISFSYVLAGTVLNILKVVCHVARPWVRDESLSPNETAMKFTSGYSFPSGHTFNIACLSTGFVMNSKRFLVRLVGVAAVILVALSRMYLGMADIWDCVFACLIAVLVMFLSELILRNLWITPEKSFRFCMIMLIPVFLMLCVTLSLYFNEIIDLENLTNSFSSAGISAGLVLSMYLEATLVDFNVNCESAGKQVVKAAIGICILCVFKIGLKLLFGFLSESFWLSGFISNFIAIMLAFGVYPYFIDRYFSFGYRK